MTAPSPAIDVQILRQSVRPVSVEPFPEAAGAECVFVGRTRAETHPEHGPLVELTYEAYAPLARRVLTDLARLAAERYACRVVRIHHAVGAVPVGAASVLVQVACGHRDEAFAACRFLIDRLKATAPIWKRQRWADGATWSAGDPVKPRET